MSQQIHMQLLLSRRKRIALVLVVAVVLLTGTFFTLRHFRLLGDETPSFHWLGVTQDTNTGMYLWTEPTNWAENAVPTENSDVFIPVNDGFNNPDIPPGTVNDQNGGLSFYAVNIENGMSLDTEAVINAGTFDGLVLNGSNGNGGEIVGGTFNNVENNGVIHNGTFSGAFANLNTGTIYGGTFTASVMNSGLGDGIAGGAFTGSVNNSGNIKSNATFSGPVTNEVGGIIVSGIFTDTVDNSGIIDMTGGGSPIPDFSVATVTRETGDAIYCPLGQSWDTYQCSGTAIPYSGNLYIWTGGSSEDNGYHSYATLANYLLHGSVPGSAPTSSDTVLVPSSTDTNKVPIYGTLYASAIYFYDDSQAGNIYNDATIYGKAVFYGTSNNTAGTINGTAIFHDSSYQQSYGTIAGNAIFLDSSSNQGIVTGNAVIGSSATNTGSVGGTTTTLSNSSTFVWLGGDTSNGFSGTSWDNPANWAGGSVPGTSDDVVIMDTNNNFDPSIPSSYSNDGNGGVTLHNVTLMGSAVLNNYAVLTVTSMTGEGLNYGLSNFGTLQGGLFELYVVNSTTGVIKGGQFSGPVDNNGGTIWDNQAPNWQTATFNGPVTNENGGNIDSGSYNREVTNTSNSYISGGHFSDGLTVTNENGALIQGGTFESSVTVNNSATINGSFEIDGPVSNNFFGIITGSSTHLTGRVENNYIISGGWFSGGSVENNGQGSIVGGTFDAIVTNWGLLNGGYYTNSVQNGNSMSNWPAIYGGTFTSSVDNYGTIYFNGYYGTPPDLNSATVTRESGDTVNCPNGNMWDGWGCSAGGISYRQDTSSADILNIPNGITSMVITPDETKMYVTESRDGNSQVHQLSAQTYSEQASLNLPNSGNFNLSITPDGSRVFETGGNQTERVITTSGTNNSQDFYSMPVDEGDVSELVFSPDGTRAYGVNGSYLYMYKVSDNEFTILGQYTNGDNLGSVAIGNGGQTLYVYDSSMSAVLYGDALNPDLNSMKNTYLMNSISPGVQGLYTSPNGSVLFIVTSSTIYGFNTSSNSSLGTFSINHSSASPVVFSPDGSKAFVGSDSSTVYVIDTSSMQSIRQITLQNSTVRVLGIKPDGSRLYVDDGGTTKVFISGAVSTWNGSNGTDWNTASNWTPAGVPADNAVVVIPSGVPNYPYIGTNISVSYLLLAANASLTLNNPLTVTGKLANGGAIYSYGLTVTCPAGQTFNSSTNTCDFVVLESSCSSSSPGIVDAVPVYNASHVAMASYSSGGVSDPGPSQVFMDGGNDPGSYTYHNVFQVDDQIDTAVTFPDSLSMLTLGLDNAIAHIQSSPDGESVYVSDGSNIKRVDHLHGQNGGNSSNDFLNNVSHQAFALSPNGLKMYVTDGSTVQVYGANINNANYAHLLTTIPDLSGADAVAFTPDGSKAVVSGRDNSNIYVIDAVTDTLLHTISAPSQSMGSDQTFAFSADGSKLYEAANAGSSIYVFSMEDYSLLNTISGGGGDGFSQVRNIAISPDGRKLFVADYNNREVYIFNTADDSFASVTKGFVEPMGFVFMPEGLVYIADAGSSVKVMKYGCYYKRANGGGPDWTDQSKWSLDGVTPSDYPGHSGSTDGALVSQTDSGPNLPPANSMDLNLGAMYIGGQGGNYAWVHSANIVGGVFWGPGTLINYGEIDNGIFDVPVSNQSNSIYGGTFNGVVDNSSHNIEVQPAGGNYAGYLRGSGIISGGSLAIDDGATLDMRHGLTFIGVSSFTNYHSDNSNILCPAGLSWNSSDVACEEVPCTAQTESSACSANQYCNTDTLLCESGCRSGSASGSYLCDVSLTPHDFYSSCIGNSVCAEGTMCGQDGQCHSSCSADSECPQYPSLATISVGAGPVSAAISPDGTKAYVVNNGDTNISVIRTSDNAVTGTIPVGGSPNFVAFSPDGTKAYVTRPGAHSISVIRTSDDTVTATVNVGNGPMSVAFSPDGSKAYVANQSSDTVSVIRTSDDTVTATISSGVGHYPVSVAFSPDGTKAYVVGMGDPHSVSVIRTSDNTVTASVTVGLAPMFVAFSPDGTKAYVVNNQSNTVSVVRTSDNTVTTTVSVGSGPFSVAFSPDGTKAFVANRDGNSISVIRTSDNTVTSTATLGINNPYSVAVSPDGTKAYVSNPGNNTVSVLDLSADYVCGQDSQCHLANAGCTSDATCGSGTRCGQDGQCHSSCTTDNQCPASALPLRVDIGSTTIAVAVSPDGTKAYAANGNNRLSVIRTSDNAVRKSVYVGGIATNIAFSPDGTKAYAVMQDGNTISVIQTSDDTVAGTISGFHNPTSVAFSPDGTKAYVTNRDGNSVSVIRTSDDTVTTTVTVGSHPRSVAFSPDGTKAYVTNQSGNTISVIRTSDNTVTATVTGFAEPFSVAFSPDGMKAYVTNTDDNTNTVSVIRTSDNTVSKNVNVDRAPDAVAFSRDGTKAYVASYALGTLSIITTASDTVTSTLTDSLGTPMSMAISPDGTKAYVADRTTFVSVFDFSSLVCGRDSQCHLTDAVCSSDAICASSAMCGQDSQCHSSCTTDNQCPAYPTSTVSVGHNPMAITATGSKVYVAHQNSTYVSIIDTANGNAVTNVTVGTNRALATIGTKVYVANGSSNTVSIIDTSNNNSVSTVTVGGNPIALVRLGSKIFVANSNSGSVSIINTANGNSVTNVTVNPGPSYLAVLGDKVYVADTVGYVSIIDTANGNAVTNLNMGGQPYTLATLGTKVYVGKNGGSVVSIIDTANGNAVTNVTVGSSPRYLAIIGNKVYVANANGTTISIIDTANGNSVTNVAVGNSTSAIAAVGTKIYVSDLNGSSVSIIDTANGNSVKNMIVGSAPRAFATSPDGTKVYVANLGSNNVSVIDLLGYTCSNDNQCHAVSQSSSSSSSSSTSSSSSSSSSTSSSSSSSSTTSSSSSSSSTGTGAVLNSNSSGGNSSVSHMNGFVVGQCSNDTDCLSASNYCNTGSSTCVLGCRSGTFSGGYACVNHSYASSCSGNTSCDVSGGYQCATDGACHALTACGTSDSSCPVNYYCASGTCTAGCRSDNECSVHQTCVNHVCAVSSSSSSSGTGTGSVLSSSSSSVAAEKSASSSSSAKVVNGGGGGGGRMGTTGGSNVTTLGTPGKSTVKGEIQSLTAVSTAEERREDRLLKRGQSSSVAPETDAEDRRQLRLLNRQQAASASASSTSGAGSTLHVSSSSSAAAQGASSSASSLQAAPSAQASASASSASSTLRDVPASAWFAPAVTKALSEGWMTAPNGIFAPARAVTVADMNAALNALHLESSSLTSLPRDTVTLTKSGFLQILSEAFPSQLQDILKTKSQSEYTRIWNAIPDSVPHHNAVRMAILAGWISLPQGGFLGNDPITRAEMATILSRIAAQK